MPPIRDDWEVIGTFNPGAVRFGRDVVLLVRVAERPREKRPGYTALPRWSIDQGFVIDWVQNDELEYLDPRVVRRRADGRVRLTFVSHLRVAVSRDGKAIDHFGRPAIMPQSPAEEFGVEDPRITPLNGRFYITYVAVSRHGTATALASTTDFETFDRHGVIFCPENKDWCYFPSVLRTSTSRYTDLWVVRRLPHLKYGSPVRTTSCIGGSISFCTAASTIGNPVVWEQARHRFPHPSAGWKYITATAVHRPAAKSALTSAPRCC